MRLILIIRLYGKSISEFTRLIKKKVIGAVYLHLLYNPISTIVSTSVQETRESTAMLQGPQCNVNKMGGVILGWV